jgi:hypothetical protein
MEHRKVIQFSVGRSGSTMIWQILKLLFRDVSKAHDKEMREVYSNSEEPLVITCRDPRDVTISLIRVQHFVNNNEGICDKINKKVLSRFATEVKKRESRLDYWCKNYTGPKLMLQYEKFYNNYDFIFSKLESFFSIKITSKTKERIIEQTSVSKNITRQEKLATFSDHCSISHIHGNHINYPDPGSHKLLLGLEDQKFLNHFLEQEIRSWERRGRD